jgi:hypothetical protein
MSIQDFLAKLPTVRVGRAPVGPVAAPFFSFGLLTLACALASFAFACATPFAAFAVMAAEMLPLSSALLVVAAAWVVNQEIGFGALHYPVDANTIAWGIAIGAAALAGTATSALVLRLTQRTSAILALGLALVVAYATYELVLFAATPFLGGEGAFTSTIVARIGVLNILWLIGLVAVSETVRLLNPYRRHQTAS